MGVHGIFCFSVSFVLFCDGGLGLRRCYLFLQWEGFFLFELGIFFVLFTCVFPFSLPYLTIAIRFIIIIRRRHYSFYLGILGKGRREERDDEMKSEKERIYKTNRQKNLSKMSIPSQQRHGLQT
jgi:hypothetical protein